MPYANNNGVKIYYEVEGEGLPLVLAHGAGSDLGGWQKLGGYRSSLKNDYKLILFDARGHGQSDKPHDPTAYGTKMADDVVAVLDDLEIEKSHYFGYSMGAWTGIILASGHSERFQSFIIGGASPYRGEATVKLIRGAVEASKLLLTDPHAWFSRSEQAMGRSLTDEERRQFLARDTEAYIAAVGGQLDVPPLTDNDLANISLPCLLYCGELDPQHSEAKESVKHLTQARFISLPGLNHMAAFTQSDLMLPHIKKFLAEVSKK